MPSFWYFLGSVVLYITAIVHKDIPMICASILFITGSIRAMFDDE